MMKRFRLTLIIAALSLGATALLPINAQATHWEPATTFYAAGSSAMFNTFGIAAGLDNAWPGNTALCGENHWSTSTSANEPSLVDPRSGSILPEKGKIWIVWDANAANNTSETPGVGRVCFYISIDSIVGNRTFFAYATVSLPPADVGLASASPDVVPLMGVGSILPQNIYDAVNGAELNVAMTDIRPEDAKFATIRALYSPAGSRVYRDHYTGEGYGSCNGGSTTSPTSGLPTGATCAIGTPVYSSQSNTQANVVDFTINGPDPISGANPRPFSTTSIGANAVMVIINTSATGTGHLGDGEFTNINRYVLANVLTGQYTHTRQLTQGATVSAASTDPDVPLHVFYREPISGTFNTMEYNVVLTQELYPTFEGAVNIGQETGVNPALTTGCPEPLTTIPCATENGNPFYHITTANGSVGATRARVIGTGEMVSTVNSTADSLGYAFWGFSNFQGKANLKYMTVDGIDPLFVTPSANPGTAYTLPACATSGGVVTSCPSLTFPNLANGGYPIWSVQRAVYDPTDSTLIVNAVINYAQHAATSSIPDFVPATALTVFRSHFNQLVVSSNSNDQFPNNGFKSGVPETGGDMGGAVLTIQSEYDYLADTNGQTINGVTCPCQQTNIFQ